MTLAGVENGTLISDFTLGTNFLWTADSDMAQDGLLATLTIAVPATVTGGDYTVDFIVRECLNGAEQPVSLYVTGGVLTVTDVTWGDANNDGKITSADIIRLKNYLANYDYDAGTSTYEVGPGADANGDGKITSADIIRLKNYLANYDYDTGTSTYSLGPAA